MEKELYLSVNNLKLIYNTDNLNFKVDIGYKCWQQDRNFNPYIKVNINGQYKKLYFKHAKNIRHSCYKNGLGEGIRGEFSGFEINSKDVGISFITLIWIDYTYTELHFELIPLKEAKNNICCVVWPGSFEFNKKDRNSYTVLTLMQGTIIPNDWEQNINIYDRWELESGKFYTRSSYMPWWGQIEQGSGYIAIVETAWDSGFIFNHDSGGPTSMGPAWNSSLGKIDYNRKIKYTFLEDCDYNELCKIYRSYVKEKGDLVTLEQKALKNPKVNNLIGSPIIHTSIYNHICPSSFFYDKENPKNNEKLVSFEKRAHQLKRLKKFGLDKAFVHVDGWGKRGYDNLHPDVFPPCEKAGGWQGMRELAKTTKNLNYMFAIHDQYRDYYMDAQTFDEEQAVHDQNEEIPNISIWAGGEQTTLCAHFSPLYLRRNFEKLKKNGVILDGAYLDVFSVVALDECFHAEHKMTRKQCMEKRRECFNYVRSQGIIISSEETVDWAVRELDLVHRSIYAFEAIPQKGKLCGKMLEKPFGIPVPLFNLVYHDCIVIPWFITKEKQETPNNESGFLHALLNGGTCYVDIEADSEEIKNAKIVYEFHKNIAKVEMLKHEFIDGNLKKQKTVFADGTTVQVNFDTNKYKISTIKNV